MRGPDEEVVSVQPRLVCELVSIFAASFFVTWQTSIMQCNRLAPVTHSTRWLSVSALAVRFMTLKAISGCSGCVTAAWACRHKIACSKVEIRHIAGVRSDAEYRFFF